MKKDIKVGDVLLWTGETNETVTNGEKYVVLGIDALEICILDDSNTKIWTRCYLLANATYTTVSCWIKL